MPETIIPRKILAIIPTYNERDNIEALLDQLYGLGIPDFGVAVIDDQSPDGTAEIVQSLKIKYPSLKLIRRHGIPGRGLAGRDGFIYALQRALVPALLRGF